MIKPPSALVARACLVLMLCALVGIGPWVLYHRVLVVRDHAARSTHLLRMEQDKILWLSAQTGSDMPLAPLLPDQVDALTRPTTLAGLNAVARRSAVGFSDVSVDVVPQASTGVYGMDYADLELTVSGRVDHLALAADAVERLRRMMVARVEVNRVVVRRLDEGGYHVVITGTLLVYRLSETSVQSDDMGQAGDSSLPETLRLDSILSFGEGRRVLLTNIGRWEGASPDPRLDLRKVSDDEVQFMWHGDALGRAYAFSLRPQQVYHFTTGRVE